MAAYIFAIVGMLIVIPILSFLPLNFSNRGTIMIAGVAFIAALLFILLQSVLDIWTALLAGIGMILISSIVLQRKGESFMLEPALDEGDPADKESEIKEQHDITDHSDDHNILEDSDIVLHKEPWIQEEPETEPEELNESFPEGEPLNSTESAIEPEEFNHSEKSELNEMDEMLNSRQEILLGEQEDIAVAPEEPIEQEPERTTEVSETFNLNDTDRSWLESAAAYDRDEAADEGKKTESPEENTEEQSELFLSRDEKLFFNNLALEEDDQNSEPSDQHSVEVAEISEDLSLQENREADAGVIQVVETHTEISEDTAHLLATDIEENPVMTEDLATDQPAPQSAEVETDIGLNEAPIESQIIDEQIFHLITSEFEAYQHPDISMLENEIRETIKLTTDPSQQYVLYRILIEQLIKQEHIPEVLSLSEEVILKFDHDFIRNEMNVLRSIL